MLAILRSKMAFDTLNSAVGRDNHIVETGFELQSMQTSQILWVDSFDAFQTT